MGGPTRAHLAELVELGRYLDSSAVFGFDGAPARVTLRRPNQYRGPWPALLLWSEPAAALVVIVAAGQWGRPRPGEASGKNAEIFNTWTRGRPQTKVREASVDLPQGRWLDLGAATSIGYRSDKFHKRGDTTDYQHQFGDGVRLYQLGAKSGALAWRGGALRITADGIEG